MFNIISISTWFLNDDDDDDDDDDDVDGDNNNNSNSNNDINNFVYRECYYKIFVDLLRIK